MAAEANVLINIEGKPYLLSKHLKKTNLIDIIKKLHEDLMKIKLFTKNQINSTTELQKLKLENQELQNVIAKLNKSDDPQGDLVQEQADIRKRMKENFEKKARYTSQIYEEKIDLLKKQITEIEKDREAFAGVIETKQNIISNLRRENELLKKQSEKTDQERKEVMHTLKQRHEEEKHRIDKDKQKTIKEMEVLQRSYIDLDKIRKYLEKNNSGLKTSLAETNIRHEECVKQLTEDFEKREKEHLNEIQKLRKDVELIIEEAETKIERIEEKMRQNADDHQRQINTVLSENEDFKAQIKCLESNEQSLKNELQMHKTLIEETDKNYKESIRCLSEKHATEKKELEKKIRQHKHDFDSRKFDLKSERDKLEIETSEKMRKISQLQTENEFLNLKITEIKQLSDENNKKYLDNYNILREKVETMKTHFETEKYDLNTEIFNRDKIIDDLTIQNTSLEKQINNLSYTNDLLKEENEKEMDKIWQKINNHKEGYLEELQKLRETHNKKIKILDNDLKQSKCDYEGLEKRHQELLQNKQNLEKNCESLRESLEKIQQDYKKELTQLKETFRKDGKYLKKDFEAQTQEIFSKNSKIRDLESDIKKLQSQNQDLQDLLKISEEKSLQEITQLKQSIEENSQFYKTDLQNMKQLLAYKETLIKELEENSRQQKDALNATIKQNQDEIRDLKLSNELKITEINNQNEIQKQKYDILIYEFYKELKEKQNQTDELTKIKSNLEIENLQLKKLKSDFHVNT